MTKRLIKMRLTEIIPYENNPRHNDNAVEAVKESIRQCEYIAPIIVDEDHIILAGHTRAKALAELGVADADVMIVSGLTDEQKRKYRLLDNKTNELATWDIDKLEIELEDIDFDGFDFGFDIGESDSVGYDSESRNLSDDFIIPPFDIFDARQRRWLDRKAAWNKRIGDTGQARAEAQAYEQKAFNNKESYKRNGKMPTPTSILDPVLSEIVLKWFTPHEGSKCFDCFAGDTVFGYVSASLGHHFTGIELRQEQVDFNIDHTKGLSCKYICDDGRNVNNHIDEGSQDLLFSCPPYFDLEVYSDLENDASNQETYQEFYDILDAAFSNSIKCLRDNRFAVVVCGDIRDKKGAYYNFPSDIVNTFKQNGMVLYNNIKLLTPIGTAQIRARRYMKSRKTAHVYQDVLVFYKGDIKEIKNEFPEIEVQIDESENEQVEWLDN